MKRKVYTREDIIQAGYDIIYHKGYNASSIRDITSEMGIPTGSFYNHFQSKEEFGEAVLSYYVQNNSDFLKKLLLDERYPPLDNLRRFFKEIIDAQEKVLKCTRACLLGNMTMELADVNDNFQAQFKKYFREFNSYFEQCLMNAQKHGEISTDEDYKRLASFIINSWYGALIRMKADKSVKPLKDFYQIVFAKVL
jgi:TetR/AcrR family transcriptional repressor of nem operon